MESALPPICFHVAHLKREIVIKGYVRRMEYPKKSNKVNFWFCAHPENAMFWETREEAETACKIFDRYSIEIPSALGGTYICRPFKIEEWESAKFLVFCEAPFIPEIKISANAET
jgi:hypothetical protein